MIGNHVLTGGGVDVDGSSLGIEAVDFVGTVPASMFLLQRRQFILQGFDPLSVFPFALGPFPVESFAGLADLPEQLPFPGRTDSPDGLCPLEHHMFEKVSQPGFSLPLLRRSRPKADIE